MRIENENMQPKKKRLIIIDANSIVHRAFHALPPLTNRRNELVNAVYGFLLVFFKIIRELQPDYVVACFDFPAPTFRHKEFKEYKAKRPPLPKELSCQIPKVKEILKAFEVPIFEKRGFEADDLIGTISKLVLSKKAPSEIEIIVLSGDLDILQLVDPHIKVWILKRGVKEGVLYDEKLIKERYGISPRQLIDFKALRGDPSDNIPGVKGIGEKTAKKLLMKYESLEDIYQKIKRKDLEDIKEQLKSILLKEKKQAFLSKKLATIKRNVPLDFNLKKCNWRKYEKEKVEGILRKFGFKSLIKRLPELEKGEKEIKENLKLW